MKELIQALQIFLKYKDLRFPTVCGHDFMVVIGITEDEVSEEDSNELHKLGFNWMDEYDGWCSYKYGSA